MPRPVVCNSRVLRSWKDCGKSEINISTCFIDGSTLKTRKKLRWYRIVESKHNYYHLIVSNTKGMLQLKIVKEKIDYKFSFCVTVMY